MRVTLVEFEERGLVLKSRRSKAFTIAYGEILTAERLPSRRGLRLHTRAVHNILISGWDGLEAIEDVLRRHGVRVVDCWGAIIAPTLLDFEYELAREPVRMRQSSDSA